jgi:hypothetical protein
MDECQACHAWKSATGTEALVKAVIRTRDEELLRGKRRIWWSSGAEVKSFEAFADFGASLGADNQVL